MFQVRHIACASALAFTAIGSAQAASYTAQANLSNLQFQVIDLTPGDGLTAGFTYDMNSPLAFVGAITVIEPVFGGSIQDVKNIRRSSPVSSSSPFDVSSQSTWADAGRTGFASAQAGTLSSGVTLNAMGSVLYTESVAAALNLDVTQPDPSVLPAQRVLVLAPYTSVTLTGLARTSLTLADATACPNCAYDIEAQTALLNSELFDTYFNGEDGNLLDSTDVLGQDYMAMGINRFYQPDQLGNVTLESTLSITLRNDTAQTKTMGFIADTWVYARTFQGVTTPVPEASTWALFAGGIATVLVAGRRRRATSHPAVA
ncbi:hypothetical protein EYS42_14895 [Aquabacterium lacunae]|uniref:PEP-CTERM protein-sorting domain-containing protein n=1 Tax=Aquabacterium lacunae TaxID=2528630 RepID=A0A4Q9H1E9_9BURK|nr:hypothetical protein [Aquabacterium lacunae]TBO28291.1 hypothetical protein EYS42_14895 [Aquabacterium lacunae]